MGKRSRKKPAKVTKKQLATSRRERDQQRRIFIAAGAFVAVFLAVVGVGLYQEYFGKARAPVATVNGVTISTSAFQKEVRYRRFSLLRAFAGATGEVSDQLRSYLQDQLPQQVLESMIGTELIRQEAKKLNIVVSPEEVTQAIEEQFGFNRTPPTPIPTPTPDLTLGITATVTPAPTPVPMTEQEFKERYQSFLTELKASIGFSEGDFRREMADNLLRDRVRQVIVAQVPDVADQVHARHILVDMEDEAKEVLERLEQGEDFAALAAELSIDPGSKELGGDLGWFPKGQMDPAFEAAAFGLAPGELSDPIQSSFGWHIIQVLERDPARPLSPDQLEQQKADAFSKWLSDLEAQSNVQRFPIEDKIPPLGLLATPAAP